MKNKPALTALTRDDVHAWMMHRRDKESISARSINSNDLIAVSAMLKWGKTREGGQLVSHDPLKDVEKLTEERKVETRDRWFTNSEALGQVHLNGRIVPVLLARIPCLPRLIPCFLAQGILL